MRTVVPLLGSVLLATSVAGSASAGAPAPAPATDAAKANDFNFAMYGALRSEKGNLFFSATSMREALGIAYLGARGDTAQQMARALRLDRDRARSAALAKKEIADFDAAKGSASLSIANRVWADKSYAPKAAFLSAASSAYASPLVPVDFRTQSEPARNAINGWVEKQTNDKIKDLLPPGSITSNTRMVITNAVWFKADWQSPFMASDTRPDDKFFVDGTTEANVAMMHQQHGFPIAAADGAKMLEMRYANSDLAMDVLLPDSKTGLSALEDKVIGGGISKWTSALRPATVKVSLPKTTFTWGRSIKAPLAKLGMTTAFDGDRADFTGIADPSATQGNLYVSDVVHKAFVAVDERGTEAAAATGATVARVTSAEIVIGEPIEFTADHPFLVVIRDVKQNRVLFTGRVTNPKT